MWSNSRVRGLYIVPFKWYLYKNSITKQKIGKNALSVKLGLKMHNNCFYSDLCSL